MLGNQEKPWSCRRHLAIAALVVLAPLLTVLAKQESSVVDADPFPLTRCVISDSVLDRKAEVFDDDGREIRVCCEKCVDEFNEERDSRVVEIDEKIVEQQGEYYPLDKCVVDAKPGEGFGLLDVVFRNRLFRVCRKECQKKLEKTPEKYFIRLDRAVIEEQKPDYPLTTCVVSGKMLGKEAIDHVVANQLVRLKDSDQLERFDQTPGKYLEELRKAARKKADK